MLLGKPEALRAAVPDGARLIGVDLGSKTLGLALSDTGWVIASPLETLRRGKFRADAERFFSLVDKHGVGGLVIGLPINMDGSEGPRCQSTRAFVANLLALRDLPLLLWDERLSTQAVNRVLIDEADVSRRRRGALVDKLVAAYILQGVLDSLR